MTGVDTVAITVGVRESAISNKSLVKAVEFIGVENQVQFNTRLVLSYLFQTYDARTIGFPPPIFFQALLKLTLTIVLLLDLKICAGCRARDA